MARHLFTLVGKCSSLDVYEEYATARKHEVNGKQSTIVFNHVESISFQKKRFLADGYILFILKTKKKLTFFVKSDKASQNEAEKACKDIESLIIAAREKADAPPPSLSKYTQAPTPTQNNINAYTGNAIYINDNDCYYDEDDEDDSEDEDEYEDEDEDEDEDECGIIRRWPIKVVGVTFNNPDGTSRQQIIQNLTEGAEVTLVVGEYEGNPSVRVDSHMGTIGYIPKEHAPEVAEKIFFGIIVCAHVYHVFGGQDGGNYGISILISQETWY